MLLCVVLMLCWSFTATEDEHASSSSTNQSVGPDKEIESRILADEPIYGIDALPISIQNSPGSSGNSDWVSQANVPVLNKALAQPSLLTNIPYFHSDYARQPIYTQNLPVLMQNQPSSFIYLLNNFPLLNNQLETSSYTASVLSKLKNLFSVGIISPSYFFQNYNRLIGSNVGGYENPTMQNQLSSFSSNNYQTNSARYSSGPSEYSLFDTPSYNYKGETSTFPCIHNKSHDVSLTQKNFVYEKNNEASLSLNDSSWSSGGLSSGVDGSMPPPSDNTRFLRPPYKDTLSYSINSPLPNNVYAPGLNKFILFGSRFYPQEPSTEQSSVRLWLSRLIAPSMSFNQNQRPPYFSAAPDIHNQFAANQPDYSSPDNHISYFPWLSGLQSYCGYFKKNSFVPRASAPPADFSGSIFIGNNRPIVNFPPLLPPYSRLSTHKPPSQALYAVGSLSSSNPLRMWLNNFIQSLLVKSPVNQPAYSKLYNSNSWQSPNFFSLRLPNQQYVFPSANDLAQSTYFVPNPPASPADFSGSVSINDVLPPTGNFPALLPPYSSLPWLHKPPSQASYALGSLSSSNPLRMWLNNFIQSLLVKYPKNNPAYNVSYNSYPWQLPNFYPPQPNQQDLIPSANYLTQSTFHPYSYSGSPLNNFCALLKTFCNSCSSNLAPFGLGKNPKPSSNQGYSLPTNYGFDSIGYRSFPPSEKAPVKRSKYYSYYPARPAHLTLLIRKELFKLMGRDRPRGMYSNTPDDSDSDSNDGAYDSDLGAGKKPSFAYDDDDGGGDEFVTYGNRNDGWLYGADRGSFSSNIDGSVRKGGISSRLLFGDDKSGGRKCGGSASPSFGDDKSVGRKGGERVPVVKGDSVVDDRIIGGEVVEPGELPYQVALYRLDVFECGSSLISTFYIITAAHCLVKYYPQEMWFRVGSESLIQGGDIYRVDKFVVHEGYASSDYDIGLVKSARKIQFGPNVRPIRLPSTRDSVIRPGTTVIASGWGATSMDGDKLPTYQLHKIELSLTSRAQCRNRIMADRRLITKRQICTSAPVGAGTCFGDSGGPLVAKGILVGIVSWGSPCAIGDPDVYTNVREFLPWIRQKTQILDYKNKYEKNSPLPNLLYNTYQGYLNR